MLGENGIELRSSREAVLLVGPHWMGQFWWRSSRTGRAGATQPAPDLVLSGAPAAPAPPGGASHCQTALVLLKQEID